LFIFSSGIVYCCWCEMHSGIYAGQSTHKSLMHPLESGRIKSHPGFSTVLCEERLWIGTCTRAATDDASREHENTSTDKNADWWTPTVSVLQFRQTIDNSTVSLWQQSLFLNYMHTITHTHTHALSQRYRHTHTHTHPNTSQPPVSTNLLIHLIKSCRWMWVRSQCSDWLRALVISQRSLSQTACLLFQLHQILLLCCLLDSHSCTTRQISQSKCLFVCNMFNSKHIIELC